MTYLTYPCGCSYLIHFGYDDGHDEDNKNWVESDGEDFELCDKHRIICEKEYSKEEIKL